jgi:hypothetical protein
MTKTMPKKKFFSLDQTQIQYLGDLLCDDIDNLLSTLNIESYKKLDRMISMSCPIHGGDNESAFNLYYQGDNYRGNWKCRTHQCEEVFKGSIIGFIRGCISHSAYGWNKPGDKTCSFFEAINFAKSFVKQELPSLKVSKKSKEKHSFINTVKYIKTSKETNKNKVSREFVKKNLAIPSKYFISRGFLPDTLIKYDVGECLTEGREMFNRAVVPIYDNEYKYMIGCSGRSLFEKCSLCKSFHNNLEKCPNNDYAWKLSKWKHSYKFKSEEHLYNFWFAQKHIKESSVVILVESPGNVWRLEEAGIHNSVAIFGSSLSDRQKMILDTSGAMTIITIMDNDDAGQKASQLISDKCSKTYNIVHAKINYPDVACMTVDQIKTELYPQLGFVL